MGEKMKRIYINSRLQPLLLDDRRSQPKDWIFSQGEPWLLLTPARFAGLAGRLGRSDGRLYRLFRLARRHSPHPEPFCRVMGVREVAQIAPADYPPVLCPRCDGVHHPHPEDTGCVCSACREEEYRMERRRLGGGVILDRRRDRIARAILYRKNPDQFLDNALSPNHKINAGRRLVRDWDAATNRIFHGMTYKEVAKEFNCSVGLLHRKVKERKPWEDN